MRLGRCSARFCWAAGKAAWGGLAVRGVGPSCGVPGCMIRVLGVWRPDMGGWFPKWGS